MDTLGNPNREENNLNGGATNANVGNLPGANKNEL